MGCSTPPQPFSRAILGTFICIIIAVRCITSIGIRITTCGTSLTQYLAPVFSSTGDNIKLTNQLTDDQPENYYKLTIKTT
jgi:hypothetical protein